MQKIDERYMRLALHEAERGRGKTHPNPMVGAVLATPSRVLGKGAHEYFGGAHAEVNALKMVKTVPKNASLYVTLEPCAHFGKTPPCADALVRRGLRRVVAAMKDPNPRVSGKGFMKLRRAGVLVKAGVLEKEAHRLNRAYLHWLRTGRPYFSLKLGQSLDGNIATRHGVSRWITGDTSRRRVQALRAGVDAVLVGARTVLEDDPLLSVRTPNGARQPVKIVLDSLLRLTPRAALFSKRSPGKTVIYTSRRSTASKRARLKSKAEVVIVREARPGRLSWKDIASDLGRRGLLHILIEGGGEVASDALFHGMVNEVYLFTAPILIGGNGARRSVAGEGAATLKEAIRFKSWTTERSGEDLLFHGEL